MYVYVYMHTDIYIAPEDNLTKALKYNDINTSFSTGKNMCKQNIAWNKNLFTNLSFKQLGYI